MDEARGAAAAATPAAERGLGIRYSNRPGLAGLVLSNYFLTLVTLSIYRFWARTRLRRYFWSNIEIAGEPLEYTGTGRELFIGFLIALAILAPLAVAYMVLVRLALGNLAASIALRLVYVVAIIALIQAAHFRARRYRLTRTAWRGIHAGQGGSTWRYIGLSFLYSLLMLATLGLAYPWMDLALARYKMSNTWFGDTRFSLDGAAGRKLFPYWLLAWALFAVPLVIAYGANWQIFVEPVRQGHATPPPHPMAFLFLLASILLGIPALIAYWVASLRYVASCTRLGGSRLRSAARIGRVIAISVGYYLALVVLTIVVGLILYAVEAGTESAVGMPQASGHLMFAVVVACALVIFLPASQLLSYCLLRARVLRHLVDTLTLENPEALASVTQSARRRQRFGEGLADSFEIGSF
ncbi:MAG TPA: DUF898 family protein [Alphaproteobacteria bacterium]|nr:DUF898 family protein [Alphaproteobacteria bacterium]